MPMKVLDLEISEEIKPIWGMEGYDGLLVLARYHRLPVGQAVITGLRHPVVSVEQLKAAIDKLAGDLMPSVLGRQFSSETAAESPSTPISVVVSADQSSRLELCLQALLAQDYSNHEIIVVDNTPRGDHAPLAGGHPVRYVREGRPGPNRARNRGIAEARYDVIAFTTGGARPDSGWLRAIACAFTDPQVTAVTGAVAASELETAAQVRFEFRYGLRHRLRRRTFRRDGLTDRELLWARDFGSGVNMAFRRDLFAAMGPFDVALDSDSPGGGSGDIEMLHRLLARGRTLVYEPAALVWHTHVRDEASLRRLIYNNGRSFGIYLLTCARNRTVSSTSILRFAIRNWLGGWLARNLWRPGDFSRRLSAIELAGALLSPLMYVKARVHARKVTLSEVRRP
ncbi:MAG TPA: glycosyltransferase [Candidatus Binatia bacterium]|jgi:cellulose synthase/poly-beta-1,6-N-acetylglucosamine synthase-like glycosyltransferase